MPAHSSHFTLVKMSRLDSFNGLVNMDLCITYYITLGFILLCVTPFFFHFKTDIQWIFGHMADTIKHTYLSTMQIFGILHQWYTLWQELRQLQPTGQWHTHTGILITNCPRHCHHKTNVSQKFGKNGYWLPLKTTLQFLRTCHKTPR